MSISSLNAESALTSALTEAESDDYSGAASTLRELYRERSELYLHGDSDDDRVDAALQDVRPLDDPAAQPDEDELDERVRQIVRDELDGE